jgi:2-(1,2-epoxy-1,2-dihydrophenyl)acetyl-CoA isomerase
MSDAAVRFETDAGIARLTLDNPAHKNAYTVAMCTALHDGIDRFARSDELKVLVVTGAGDAFCAGGNLDCKEDFAAADARVMGHAALMRESMHAVNLALHRLDKPTIAMINGVAVAGGLTLALLCDFRIAGASARLGDPSGRAGLLADEGGAWLFPRVMGLEAALRMTLLGEIYDAQTALGLGLVGEVVADERLEARVAALADALASKAPLVVRAVKRLMRRSLTQSFEQSLGDVELVLDSINRSADAKEGVAAFLAKRAPRFVGR